VPPGLRVDHDEPASRAVPDEREDDLRRPAREVDPLVDAGAEANRLAERLLRIARNFAENTPEVGELSVRIGCYGITDVAEETGEPVELMVRAVMALHRAQASNVEICAFGAIP
jgi:hypothetical protein